MSTLLWLALALFFVAGAVSSQDPVKTDPDKYFLRLENDRVRVLDYRDKPGDKTTMHHHPDFILYAIAPFKRRLTFPDGKTMEREFKAGDVIYMPAQDHIGENIGTTETHVVIVEFKQPPPDSSAKPVPDSAWHRGH